MSKIVYKPKKHICDFLNGNINNGWHYQAFEDLSTYSDGTVRECGTCGKTWVSQSMPGWGCSFWRKEGKFARWFREKVYGFDSIIEEDMV